MNCLLVGEKNAGHPSSGISGVKLPAPNQLWVAEPCLPGWITV